MTDHPPSNGQRIAFDHWDPEDERRREALLALGNGCLYLRASAPEAAAAYAHGHPCHYAGLYRAGWYDEAPRRVNDCTVDMAALVNLPNPFALSFAIGDGPWFALEDSELLEYRQVLALDTGLLTRELVVRPDGERAIQLSETRLVSMVAPHTGLLRWHLRPLGWSGRLQLRSVLDAGVRNALVERNAAYEGQRLQHTMLAHDRAGRAAAGARLDDPTRRVTVATQSRIAGHTPEWQTTRDGARLIQQTSVEVTAGQMLTLDRTALVHVDGDIATPDSDPHGLQHAMAALDELPDGDTLIADHGHAWRELWEYMPITAASPTLERALRLHRFHLLQTLSPRSVARDLGFPPRGWQEGYFGQVFWDELFAFPFLASHFPAIARALLRYRYQRLPAARERARRSGLRGAMFPWRSARSGEEETPPYQFNPLMQRWTPDHSHLQRHIGSAIAWNVWQYWLATGDRALLAGEGGEVLLEVARFWASAAQHDASRQRYVICGVLGPDEYHDAWPGSDTPGFDNNAYTNVMAVWTLCRALELLKIVSAGEAAALQQRLAITPEELAHWDHVSRHMYVPFVAPGIIAQFEGFETLRPPTAVRLDDDHPRVDWWLASRGDSVDAYQLTKQADVLMLMYLLSPDGLGALLTRLGYSFDQKACRRTIDYYMDRLTHESSLSRLVCAGALAQLDPQASWQFYDSSLHTDFKAPGNRGTEEGVHLGAMAGTLDVLQRHYLGVQPTAEALQIYPAPPARLGEVTMDALYHDQRLMLALTDDGLQITASADNADGMVIATVDGRLTLAPGETRHIPVRHHNEH